MHLNNSLYNPDQYQLLIDLAKKLLLETKAKQLKKDRKEKLKKINNNEKNS